MTNSQEKRVNAVSDKALEAMARIEEEAKAAYRAEIEASATLKPKAPVDYSNGDLEDFVPTPSSSFTPRSSVAALRGDIKKVTRPYPERGDVYGPSAGVFDKLDKADAERRLAELEAAEAARAAEEASQPMNLQADLQAKGRIISRLERKLNQALKRLDELEGEKS